MSRKDFQVIVEALGKGKAIYASHSTGWNAIDMVQDDLADSFAFGDVRFDAETFHNAVAVHESAWRLAMDEG